jgi:hypothetical protein
MNCQIKFRLLHLIEQFATAFFQSVLAAVCLANPILGIALLAAITAIVAGVLTYALSNNEPKISV